MKIGALRPLAIAAVVAVTATSVATPAQAADDTGTISGRLTTSSGAAAAGVTVQIFDGLSWGWRGETTTASDGTYTVEGLSPDDYLVGFFPPGQAEQYYDDKTQIWDADPVPVAAGATATVDEALLPTGTVSGRLLRADGSPLVLATVVVEAEDGGESFADTDNDGRFRLAVRPGDYRVAFEPVDGSDQRQYVPGQVDREAAAVFHIASDQEVTVDDTALPTGTIAGRLTTPTGEPAADIPVAADAPSDGYTGLSARTDADGRYTIAPVLVGTYIVGFTKDEFSPPQYHRHTYDPTAAEPVVVSAGAVTRVNESLLANGTVRISAVDSLTGTPIARFCVETCTTTGSMEITDLRPGLFEFAVNTPGGSYFSRALSVTVRPARTIDVTVRLRPAAQITTTVVDAATGRALSNVCLTVYKPKQVRLHDGIDGSACSNFFGTVTIGQLTNGNYRLFATPLDDAYGRQWVGATGGTGDERQAVVVQAVRGTVATAPQIRVDRAGSIAGTVTDAETGDPVESARIALFTQHPGLGADEVETDDQGHYQIDGLGPYAWPLKFAGVGNALSWTGGASSRYAATPTQVTIGATATADATLTDGVTVRGTIVTDGGAPLDGGFVMVRNAQTGDISGSGWVENGQFSTRVMPGQRIYLSYEVYLGDTEYEVDRVPGDIVRVPAGGLETAIVVPTT